MTQFHNKKIFASSLCCALLVLALMAGCASPPVADTRVLPKTSAMPTMPAAARAACYRPTCCDETLDAAALRFEPHRLNCRAIALTAEGRDNESLSALQTAVALAKAETAQKMAATEVLCFALNDIAHRADARGDDVGSRTPFDGNLAACKARFGDASDEAAQALFGGASQHLRRGRYDVARPQLLQVIALSRGNGNRGLESFATDALGRLYDERGDHVEGRRLLREAIAIKTTVFGARSKELAVSFTNLGASYIDSNEGKTGRDWYRKAIALYTETLGAANASTLDVESALAASHLGDGETQQAEHLYELLLPKFVQTYGGTDERTVVIINDWGASLARQKRYSDALIKFEQALSIRRSTVPNSVRHGYSVLNAAKMKKVTSTCTAAEPLRNEARRVSSANMTPAQRANPDAVRFVKGVVAFEQECAPSKKK